MPRILSVSDVRKHLYWAAGGPGGAGDREPTIGLLGSLFHQLFGQLTGPDPHLNLVGPLQLADATLESWQEALTTHAYKTFVAAALSAGSKGARCRNPLDLRDTAPEQGHREGVIDANFSGRVALRVVRPIDSRLILDESGAETLLGRGDLLYKDSGGRRRVGQELSVTAAAGRGLLSPQRKRYAAGVKRIPVYV